MLRVGLPNRPSPGSFNPHPARRLDATKRRNLSERIAVNTIIQGSAADLIKVAMNKIHARLKNTEYEAKMLLQIHDELLFEVKENALELTRSMVLAEMGHAVTLNVPIKVNMKIGKNWMEAE